MLNDLLRKDFIVHYNITSKDVVVDYQTTAAEEFDLDDMPSPIKILPLGKGGLSFEGNSEQIEVVHYEDFIAQCKKPQVFANGRKRCDYVVCSMRQAENKGHVILAELTSALGGAYNLARPIRKGQDLEYRGGKYEKAAKQLGESLATLMEVPTIRSYFNCMEDKQCLMAYKINSYDDPLKRMLHPMDRYLMIESAETQNNGAEIADVIINSFGFTYRRIRHGAYYQL